MTEPGGSRDEQYRKPFWRQGRWRLVGAILFVAMLALVYLCSGWEGVRRQMGAIRARGEPVTMQELSDYYTYPPAEQDATQLWLRGARSIPGNSFDAKQLPVFSAPKIPAFDQPWAELEPVRQFLDDNAQALRDLHDAAALGGKARYPVDFSDLFTLLPDIQLLRTAARCLLLEAHVRARDGDYHGAAESLRACLLLSESLAQEPILVTQLLRIAFHGMALREFQCIGPNHFAPKELTQFQLLLSGIEFAPARRRSLIGERVIGIAAFHDDLGPLAPQQSKELLLLVRGHDKSTYLANMEQYIVASDLPWLESTQEFDRLSISQAPGRFTFVTNQFMSGLKDAMQPFVRAETLNRLAMIEMAIARYQQRHGRLPADLAALTPEFIPEIPLDPSTESAFNYKATESGHVLYSPATIFPMGDEPADAETGAHPQLIFRWPPLPAAPQEAPTNETPADGQVAPPAE